jgi:UDP-N-acetylglucosamine 2-epimerase (non-hydrolysing)
MSVLKVAVIAAERGAFVKAASLLAELRQHPECDPQFIFAGEDYVPHANSELFRDLDMPFADMVIGASEGTRSQRLAKVMAGCERLAHGGAVDALVLMGASHTILGCALASARAPLLLAHADAGLRAPGIVGRTSLAAQIDHCCSVLLAASEQAQERLIDEGMAEDAVTLSGALVCDAVAQRIELARADGAAERLGLVRKGYLLAIIESAENIENLPNLRKLVELLTLAQYQLPVALAFNARLSRRLREWQFDREMAELPHVFSVDPPGYLGYLSLLDSARVVLTDVGGVQDEATFLGVPCLTMCEMTDRAATVDGGGNLLVARDIDLAMQAIDAMVKNEYAQPPLPAAWEGCASSRIVDALLQAAAGKAQA